MFLQIKREANKKSHTGDKRPGSRSISDGTYLHPLIQPQHTIGNSKAIRTIQTKMEIGQDGDKYEQEADRTADIMMQTPDFAAQKPEEKTEKHNSKEAGSIFSPAYHTLQSQTSNLKSSGRPLPESVRVFYEPRFKFDFGRVRIHANTQAAKATELINARAFTTGNDVVFGAGQYSPETSRGKKLLAHELTHVVQQRGTSRGDCIQRDRKQKTKQKKCFLYKIPVIGKMLKIPILNEITNKLCETGDRWKTNLKDKSKFTKTSFDTLRKLYLGLNNLYFAYAILPGTTQYKDVKSEKLLEIAENLSGFKDTEKELVFAVLSFGLQMDIAKYLKDEVPEIVKKNIGWLMFYFSTVQSIITGIQAATKSDLDILGVFGFGAEQLELGKQPAGFERLLMKNVPDPRWTFGFWSTPKTLELKLENWYDKEKPNTWKFNLAFNLQSLLELTSGKSKSKKSKADKKKALKQTELFSYLTLRHSSEETRALGGIMGGGGGLYAFGEGGYGKPKTGGEEYYTRFGLLTRGIIPRTNLGVSGEMLGTRTSGEPSIWRQRLNLFGSSNIIDTKRFNLSLGANVGVVLPSGGLPAGADISAKLGAHHLSKPAWLPKESDPLKTGLTLTGMYRHQNPFDVTSSRLLSLGGRLTIFDAVMLGMEFHQITGSNLDTSLPQKDVRFMLTIDPIRLARIMGKGLK